MKYCIFLLLMVSLNCFGQDYKSQIEDFRNKYKSDFLTDQNSPLKKEDLQFLRFFDADSTYRVIATKQVLANQPIFLMETFSGNGQQYIRYALLKFTLKGKAMQLNVYRSVALAGTDYKDYLFLPFTDDSNGKETYEGGRYIDMDVKNFTGNKVVIDFNKAYNPYCAFGAGYLCPKPPDVNHLETTIQAGEKQFAGKKKESLPSN